MRLSNFARLGNVLLRNPSVYLQKKEYIFVVSHMRSYSSLFCHILGSHNDVSGYSEMHQPYNGQLDLLFLKYKVFLSNNNNLGGRFVLDKILHNYCRLSDEILEMKNIHLVFMLRKPEPSLKSIINMGKNIVDVEWFQDPRKVVEYYIDRLGKIAEYGRISKNRAIYFDAEKIIESPELVLDYLSEHLTMSEKLKPEYTTFKHTGSPDFGDPSDTIKEGKIVKKANEHQEIILQADMLKRAETAYNNCRDILIKHCDSI